MEYKSEQITTNFGKGVRIEKDGQSYEQLTCRDGLNARIFRAPTKDMGRLFNTDYHGAIFRQLFKDTEADYEQFKILAERLQQASGEEVPNTKARFMDYIAHSGLEKELPRIGSTIKINLKDKKELPDKTNSWLTSRGHLGGAITSLAGYAGGFAVIANTVPNAELWRELGLYGLLFPIVEGVVGLIASMGLDQRSWCGPFHAPGYITSRIINHNKLRDPNYMLNNFLQNYQRLENMSSSVGNQKNFAKQSKLADRHFGVLEELFPFTEHQKGFSINYHSKNRDDVLNFFDYVLEGRNASGLPNSKTKVSKQKSEEKPVETQPVKTNFINPWEIEIPKIERKEK